MRHEFISFRIGNFPFGLGFRAPPFLCLGGPFLGAKRGFILNPILQPLFEVPIQFRLDLIAVSMWILIRVFALITIGTTRFDVDWWMSVECLHFLHFI